MSDPELVRALRGEKVRVTTVSSFTVEVGALIRGRIRREIEGEAWRRGLEIRVRESKGMLESVYQFTVSGDSMGVRRFVRDIRAWFRKVEGA